jgi:pimeloyl-ACP methyl ester carboxylesterase
MSIDEQIRRAESNLFGFYELSIEESYVELFRTGGRVRVLRTGEGPAIVLLHGVSLSAAVWAPLLTALSGYRIHLVDLPGHGLSGPATYQPGAVREPTVGLLDDLLDALGLQNVPIVGHSLGGLFALWYAHQRPQRIASVIAVGAPATALPGVAVRMPLSLMTIPIVGPLILQTPTPPPFYRHMLGRGLSPAAVSIAPAALLDALRLSSRRPQNAKTVASLMHALNHFRHPRPTSVISDAELRQITVPTTFIWGQDDPFLTPGKARDSITKIPNAILHEVPGGHGPWFENPGVCAALISQHLTGATA